MNSKSKKHSQAVIDYYDGTRAEYRLLWRNRHNLGLHFGYYDDTHKTHDEAILNLNAQLASKIGIASDDIVLDAGCGVGGSAIWLAQNIGCKATGINITPRQVDRAKDNAIARNVSALTTFEVADFMEVPFQPETFTVFWGVESIVHAEDKQVVLDEAYRLLKKGGRLVIAEYLLPERKLSKNEITLLNTWLNGWSMPCLESDSSYGAMLQKSGFKHYEIDDWTEHMLPSIKRLGSFSKKFTYVAPALSMVGLANKNQLNNLKATEAQMRLLESGAWRYKVVTAVK